MELLGGGNVLFYKSSLRVVGFVVVCFLCFGFYLYELMLR